MKKNEIVWRTIADHALVRERRRWESIADLAFESGVHEQTTYLAVRKLREIGAVTMFGRSGISVTSPDKVVTVLSAWRNITADTVTRTTFEAIGALAGEGVKVFAGGFDAAVHHLGGVNTVADYSAAAAYVGEADLAGRLFPEGDDIAIVRTDERATQTWLGVASVAQTIADLFATPGWQSAEFRYAMLDRYVPRRDWDQR